MEVKNYGNNILENIEQSKQAALSLRDDSCQEIFKIDYDGKIWYMQKGKLTEAKCDTEIGQAFAMCVYSLAGVDYTEIINKIKDAAIVGFLSKIINKG